MQTAHDSKDLHASHKARTLSLDDLAALKSEELDRMYRRATCPASITDVSGLPRGRMLAVRGVDSGITGTLLRRFAGGKGFPWGGKTFTGQGKSGEGINRVHLGGRHAVFPFKLRIGPSMIDGDDAVLLDYDLPDNPWAIRHIHDEVREVAPGLLMGPAMWKRSGGGRPTLVLWFALDLHDMAAPIGESQEERRSRERNGAFS